MKFLKTFILINILASLISCKELSNAFQQKFIFRTNKKINFTDDGKSKINISINHQFYNLIYDTGSGKDLLLNKILFRIEDEKIIGNKKISGFNKNSKADLLNYISDTIKSDAFTISKAAIFINQNAEKKLCDRNNYDGLTNVLANSEYPVEINYQNSYIKLLESIPNDYKEIDSKFNAINQLFRIKLNIGGSEDYYLFDTGNFGPIAIDNSANKKVTKITNFNLMSIVVGDKYINSNYEMYDTSIHLGNEKIEYYVGLDNNNKVNVVSQKFIKMFDWVIDYKNKKVYFKPNLSKKNISYKAIEKKQMVTESNEQIMIYYAAENSKYSIGTKIISVNGEKVSSGNICEMQELLNKTEDWDALKLEVKKN